MNAKKPSVLIIGASGGIGGAVARALSDSAGSLHLLGRNALRLEALAKTLNCTTRLIVADLNLAEDRQQTIDSLRAEGHIIDIVINLAGISEFSLFENLHPARIDQLIQTNLTSPIIFTQQLLPLLNPEGARIVNVGSTFGAIGYPGNATYCATKFGLRGFSEALARELDGTPIKVQYIAPRATDTSMNSSSVSELNRTLGNSVDSAEYVAQQIVALTRSNRRVLNLGWPEKLLIPLNSVFQSLVDRAITSSLPQIKQFAQENNHA